MQHFEPLSRLLLGRCSMCSTSREVRGGPATIDYYGRRLLWRGRCTTWSTSVSFCVASAGLGAPQSHFVRQVPHLGFDLFASVFSFSSAFPADIIAHPPTSSTHQQPHHQHNTIDYITPSTKRFQYNIINTTRYTLHQHKIINTTSSTHRHLHSTNYTTLSAQHHLHYIIKHWQVSTWSPWSSCWGLFFVLFR